MTESERLVAECCKLWAPPPKQSVSDWAEEHFRLSPEYSAQTGKLKLYTFQRAPIDAFGDPYTSEIVIMSATQMLKTLAMQVCIAYAIARDPGPILLAQPTTSDAETFSKERLGPMVRDMECLRTRVAPEKRTSKGNTILQKVFDDGSLSLIGAQTAGNFARRSIRYFFGDERDKWPKNVGKEGDGWSLGIKRQATFRNRAKRLQACSPTIEGDSQIATAYENSDQRKFWVPCPHCGHHQVLRWDRVTWDTAGAALRDLRSQLRLTTAYLCEQCNGRWSDAERWAACEQGEWRADKPFSGIAGFWISEIYSPWKRLADLVFDFLTKKDDPVLLQTFVNTSLAETWKEKGEAPDHEKLMSRRESYRLGQVPPGVLFLTCGIDAQASWMEGYVYGWGRGKQRWVVDRFRLERSPYDPRVWPELDERIEATYSNRNGIELPIVRTAIDTGYGTQEVYNWVRSKGPGSTVHAVDGRSSGVSIVGTPSPIEVTKGGRKVKYGIKLWPVNVSMCKSELYGLLGKERPKAGDPYPAGWVHFAADLDEEFFLQLTAEQLTSRVVDGYRKYAWSKTRERNEALDCANYARAAAVIFGIDRFSEHRWRQMEEQAGLTPGAALPIETVDVDDAEELVETVVEPVVAKVDPPKPAPAAIVRRSPITPSNWMRSFLG